MTPTGGSYKRRCAACSYFHRACPPLCAGYRDYPDIISRNDYHLMFQIYGVGGASKIFDLVPRNQRHECIHSLLFEAKARIQNPSSGCGGQISFLEYMVGELYSKVMALEARLDERSINVSLGPSPVVKGGYMDLLMATEEDASGAYPVQESLAKTVAFPTVPTSSPYLTMIDYQAVLARCYQSSEVGCSSTPIEEVSHVSPERITKLGSPDDHAGGQMSHLEIDISHYRPVKRLRLEQTDPAFTDEDLSGIELLQGTWSDPIDLSSLGYDAGGFFDFGAEKRNEICNLMNQFSPGLELDGLWETGTDQRLDQVGRVEYRAQEAVEIVEIRAEETETHLSPLVDSKGKAPMGD